MLDSNLPKCASCGKEISKVAGTGENIKLNIDGKKLDVGTLYNGKICWDCRQILCLNCIMDFVVSKNKFDALEKCQICGGEMLPLSSKVLP
jgi:hypothetical protein